MSAYDALFDACLLQAASIWPQSIAENESLTASLCKSLAKNASAINRANEVLDFELLSPVALAWWINGLFFTFVLSTTAILNLISIHIFLDSSMRSPTNILLAAITTLDLLTCLSKAPTNIYVYLMDGYKELPSYTWCVIYLYISNFLGPLFHGTSFLLNMYLSIQRFVGIRDLKRCHGVGTYKGAISAIIASSVISLTIISIYIIVLKAEAVSAISKKVMSPSGFYSVSTCRIVPRVHSDYNCLMTIHLWLRLLVLKIPPAIVLSACNIALIRASYRTHVYRKRLVGTLGTIADSTASSRAGKSTIVTVSGVVSCQQGRGPTSGTGWARQLISPERVGRWRSTDDDENRATKEYPKLRCWPLLRKGLVTPITSCSGDKISMAVECLTSLELAEKGDGVIPLATPKLATGESRDTHHWNNESQQTTYSSNVKNENDINIDDFNLQEKFQPWGKDCRHGLSASMGIITSDLSWSAVKDNSHDRQGELYPPGDNVNTHIDDVYVDDIIPGQVPMTDKPWVGGQVASSPENSSKPSLELQGATIQPKGRSRLSYPDINKSGCNNRTKPNIRVISAEIRSTILLLLVTSCTLVTEVFTIILLLLSFIVNHVLTDRKVVSISAMDAFIMIANMLVLTVIPFNFAFFCGLSRAFRSSLRARFRTLTRKIKLGH